MPVPEAAVDEDDRAVFGEDDIRAPWQIASVEAIAEPERKETSPDHVLRLGVLSSNPGHAVAALARGQDIGHSGCQSTTERSARNLRSVAPESDPRITYTIE